ncbi:MAG: two-component system alkaline phosphatase synthesis response regulator PhoP [Cellvibrionaceae bacterium]|jgi:two-component system alkaline phosphatase synthesis response regulator PhoP
MNEQILIVDDEPKIIKLARDYLEKSGYKVLTSGNGREALAIFRQENPAMVVLDLNLPEIDGLDVCRIIRKESNVPIIMLTARAEETDQLIGLELGADDYITKPFSPRALVARIRAVLRRAGGDLTQSHVLKVGDLEIDKRGYTVLRGDDPIALSRTEFNLLLLFAESPGQAFTRAQILNQLHGFAYEGFDRSIDAHIKNLRRKLEPNPAEPRYILTVYGIGYKFSE